MGEGVFLGKVVFTNNLPTAYCHRSYGVISSLSGADRVGGIANGEPDSLLFDGPY